MLERIITTVLFVANSVYLLDVGCCIPGIVKIDAGIQAVVPLKGIVHVRQHVDPGIKGCQNFAIGEDVPGVRVSLDAGLDLQR